MLVKIVMTLEGEGRVMILQEYRIPFIGIQKSFYEIRKLVFKYMKKIG